MDGLSIGYVEPLLRPATATGLRTAVRLSEAAGIDHLGVCDHVSFHVGAGFDGLLAAGTILAVAERLESNTGVYLLPLRHPVLVARQVADLALLAPGRFTFGVGLGGEDPHEVSICGVDPRTRGRRMDECMRVVRELLTGQPVDHDGEFFHLEGAQIGPAPSEPVPMVVGGRSDAALTRAGRLGDGWISVFVSAKRYAQAIAQMEQAADDAGRDVVAGGATASTSGAGSAGTPTRPGPSWPRPWRPSTKCPTSDSSATARPGRPQSWPTTSSPTPRRAAPSSTS